MRFESALTKLLLSVCMLLLSLLPNYSAAQKKTRDLTIEITGLRNNKGKVLISVYNSSNGFPDNIATALYKADVRPVNNVARFVHHPPADGTYAIAVLHDENDNLKMDKKALGLPKEGYGFSQNVMGMFGPPSFKKASFKFPDQQNILIKLRY